MHSRIFANSLCVLASLVVMLLATACGETERPPTAITLDQIPVELAKAFASAKAEAKELSDAAIAAVQSKEFPKAARALDALDRRPDLTKVQSRTTAGAAMTVNAALLEAESKGDPRAAELLQARRLSK